MRMDSAFGGAAVMQDLVKGSLGSSQLLHAGMSHRHGHKLAQEVMFIMFCLVHGLGSNVH